VVPLLIAKLLNDYVDKKTFLVKHKVRGFRSNYSSFGSICYAVYAMLKYSKIFNDVKCMNIAGQIIKNLVQLQGPNGQWAWFYNVKTGEIVDYYQVYSVHQYAMAPFFLLEAIDHGYEEFREPLKKGFLWIFGNNEILTSMLSPDLNIIWRSLVRSYFLKYTYIDKGARFLRGVLNLPSKTTKANLYINKECRSYELGWGLWAFAGRDDFDDLLNCLDFKN